MLDWIIKKLKKNLRKFIVFSINCIILYHMHTGRHKSGKRIFLIVWEKIKKNSFYRQSFGFIDNPYRLDYLDFFYHRILIIFQKHHINFVPKIIIQSNQKISNLINLQESNIIVGIHDGFAFTTRLISEQTKSISAIALSARKTQSEGFKMTGVRAGVNVIEADRYSLVNVLSCFKSNHTLCSHVDFRFDTNEYVFISPALFQLSIDNKIPLYFSSFKVNDKGVINAYFKKSPNSKIATTTINEFIKFINETSGYTRRFKILKYQKNRSLKSRSAKAFINTCVKPVNKASAGIGLFKFSK
jgi:hypothetical protein